MNAVLAIYRMAFIGQERVYNTLKFNLISSVKCLQLMK